MVQDVTATPKRDIQIIPFIICIVIGLLIWFSPIPQGVDPRGWHLLAIFASTIIGLIIKPLPMGALTLISFTLSIITNTISEQQAFEAFQSQVVWLVVMAFFIAKGFVSTNFGHRIAYFFTGLLGKNTLGLSYGLALTDYIMAPAVPSVTARCAGIIYPIVQSIAHSFGSLPNAPSSTRIGAYLTVTAFQVTVITSGMFMTAMAANPLLAELSIAQNLQVTWSTWAIAATVPGLLSLLTVPLVIYYIYPPAIKSTPNAASIAKEQLRILGNMSRSEWIMAMTLLLLIGLWIFGSYIHISPVVAAMIGLSILLSTGVLNWKTLLEESNAWGTYFWFCILLLLAKYLGIYGLFDWLTEKISFIFIGVDWKIGFPLLGLLYFYSHYFFASSTAHVSAMYVPFLLTSIGLGTPPMLAAMILIFFSNLFGGLTHYSLAPAPLMYGVGYVDIKNWWKIGFIVSCINLLIWCLIGPIWWKVLDLW